MLNKKNNLFSVVFAISRLHRGCESIWALRLLVRCADMENHTSDLLAIHRTKVTRTDCRHVKIHHLVQRGVIWVSKKRISKSSSFLN